MINLKKHIKDIINFISRMKLNFHRGYTIGKGTRIAHCSFDNPVHIGAFCDIAGSSIGKYTYIGDNSKMSHTKIGSFCSIAPNVIVAAGMHPQTYVSTSPITYSNLDFFEKKFTEKNSFIDEYVYVDDEKKFVCDIGNDVWIATGVMIICGKKAMKIGDGAIIKAGSIVTKEIPPYAIVQGSPAKVVGYRFDNDKIEKLLQIKWWEQNDEWIKNNIDYFNNVDMFLTHIQGSI